MSRTLPSAPPVADPGPTPVGRALYHLRVPVLLGAAVVLGVGLFWGTGVFGRLSGGGFQTPGSDSLLVDERITQEFGRQGSSVVMIYASDRLPVADPRFRAAVERTLAAVPAAALTDVKTTWTTGSPTLISADGHQTLVLLEVTGADEKARTTTYLQIADRLVAGGDLQTYRGGHVPTAVDVSTRIRQDLIHAEVLSAPILLVLLVLVFGGLVAASVPLLIGGIAILGAFTALHVLSYATDISVFAINIVTMLGLGLAIDYALLVVSRFREEMGRAGGTRTAVPVALSRTMATAGRSVLVSGVTVAVSLGALLFFPQTFLKSMGMGAISAVLIALVAALTVLPALLAVLGPNIDSLRWRRSRAAAPDATDEQGSWARLARAVMRRPALVAGGLTAVLLVIALPVTWISFGGTDQRVLPPGTESRVVAERLVGDFPGIATDSLDVVVDGADPQRIDTLLAEVVAIPDVVTATVVERSGDAALVSVVVRPDPQAARGVVAQVRALPVPDGLGVLVGGDAAEEVDTLSALAAQVPRAAGFVVLVTLLLLFLAFGSIVLPIKAVLMSALSLATMFGVLVWVFQDGHLASALGVTVTGTVEATQPVIMVAAAFGLSMDYEVFLLSRMREEWDRTGDNPRAIALGLQRTGRIVTSAALLLVVVIGAFATSGVSLITMIGIGLGFVILLDATVIRILLVPATMSLLGRGNWWLPAPLRPVWERLGIHEPGDERHAAR